MLQNGQLKIAESLSLRETLVKELLNFRVKINISTVHDSYEAWREGDHDDLVLSVALACWAGERYMTKEESVPRPGYIASEVPINVASGRVYLGVRLAGSRESIPIWRIRPTLTRRPLVL